MQHNLQKTVIENGYCIGCGACSVVSPNYKIKLNSLGQYQATLSSTDAITDEEIVSKVCPFSNNSPNEDQLSEELFPDLKYNSMLGRVANNYFGHSKEFRLKGASGGLTTWFLQKLIKEGIVDGVIHLKEDSSSNRKVLLKYTISSTIEEVIEGSKTKYYPGEMSEIFQKIMSEPENKKYALVGVPCFIKAGRLLTKSVPNLDTKITFFIGLICGHYKSTQYSEMLAMQKGIQKRDINRIDFRHKPGYGNAGDYHTKIDYQKDDRLLEYSQSVKNFYGTNWGLGFFKYNACDYCDDVVGETADISFGDAWVDPYSKDHKGTNVVIIRNKTCDQIFQKGYANSEIHIENTTNEQVIKTQLAGFKHRREGLSLRLFWKVKRNLWMPKKRVAPSNNVTLKYKIIYALRLKLTKSSHRFFKYGKKYNSFYLFQLLMFPLVFLYIDVIYGAAKVLLYLKKNFNN